MLHVFLSFPACNVLYINSVDMESLTGPQAIAKAISETTATSPTPSATIVHFKVSAQGITLTDNQRKWVFLYFYLHLNVLKSYIWTCFESTYLSFHQQAFLQTSLSHQHGHVLRHWSTGEEVSKPWNISFNFSHSSQCHNIYTMISGSGDTIRIMFVLVRQYRCYCGSILQFKTFSKL